MGYIDEEDVAHEAERRLTAALRARIGSLGFKHHVSDKANQRISDAFGISRYKAGRAKDGGTRTYMNSLGLVMPVHGFIQNYGDTGVRAGGNRTRHRPHTRTYTVRSHSWKLPARDFISSAIEQSGVVPYVAENIARARGEEIVIYLKNHFDRGKY